MPKGHHMCLEKFHQEKLIPRLILIKWLDFKMFSKNKSRLGFKVSWSHLERTKSKVGITLRLTYKERK